MEVFPIKDSQSSYILYVYAKPKSKKNKIGGWIKQGDQMALQIWIVDPPEGGQANKAIIELLATHLKVAKSTIKLVKGFSSRYKVLKIAPWNSLLEQKLPKCEKSLSLWPN